MFLSPCRPADDAVLEDFTSVCPSNERPPRRKQWHVAIVCAGQIWTVGGFSVRGSYRLVPCDADSVIVASSPKASAYFLPPNSILVRDWLPSLFVLNSVASLGSA